MFKKFFRTVLTVVYSGFLLGAAVIAWDFTQHWKSAEGEYDIGQYVTYLTETYGDDVQAYSGVAVNIAQTSWGQAKLLAETTGVADAVGDLMPQDAVVEEEVIAEIVIVEADAPLEAVQEEDAPVLVTVEPAPQVEEPKAEEVIVVASTNDVAAPETSLFPQARAFAQN